MENCIFCQIVAGKSPCYKVYEDNLFIGFLDIYPHVEGHTLLIPKKHYRWVYDYPEFGRYWQTTLVVTRAIQKALSPAFITYLTIGVDVAHAHIHILPRFGEFEVYQAVKNISKEKMEEIANKIYKEVKKYDQV